MSCVCTFLQNAKDRVFEARSCQTTDYKHGICWFYTALNSKQTVATDRDHIRHREWSGYMWCRTVTRGLKQGRQSVGAVDWDPIKSGLGRSHPYENSDLMAQNNAFFFKSISILLRRLYIHVPVTIVNSNHAVEASMLWKIKHNTTD